MHYITLHTFHTTTLTSAPSTDDSLWLISSIENPNEITFSGKGSVEGLTTWRTMTNKDMIDESWNISARWTRGVEIIREWKANLTG